MNMLDQKTILITGASRGIGAATALACVENGARVILHASAMSDAARALEAELKSGGGRFICEDLAREGAGARLVQACLEMSGGTLDAVVNNAGVYLPTPLSTDEEHAWEAGWQRTMAVNVQAPADIMRAFIGHLRKGDRKGSIVNIASRAGHRGDGIDHAGYAASKGALLALSKTWARALSGEGIEIYCIAPGWVETRMAPEDIEARKRAVGEIPLGRVAAPAEIAALVAFLVSGQCPSAVGATFDVNGASYVR